MSTCPNYTVGRIKRTDEHMISCHSLPPLALSQFSVVHLDVRHLQCSVQLLFFFHQLPRHESRCRHSHSCSSCGQLLQLRYQHLGFVVEFSLREVWLLERKNGLANYGPILTITVEWSYLLQSNTILSLTKTILIKKCLLAYLGNLRNEGSMLLCSFEIRESRKLWQEFPL